MGISTALAGAIRQSASDKAYRRLRAAPHIPERTNLHGALRLAGLFTAITFLVHFVSSLWGSHLGYGFFRDELYFLVCGHHLAWGYVDQPPLVALQARLAEAIFGLSPTGVRIFSFMAGGITVGLAGLLTWQLGGRRSAQVLAMMATLASPVILGITNFLSMNAFEPCFWMGALLVVLRIAEGSARPRAWILFGVLAGLGIENKDTIVFFLVALLAGLLLSPQRHILWTKECAAGVAVLLLLALPNFIWQWVHQFPTYQFLDTVAHTDKNVRLSPVEFFYQQMKVELIVAAPLWIGGVVWLMLARKAREWRFVGLTFLVFLAMMMAMHAKNYYLAPIYPVLFAAGAVALGELARRRWPTIVYAAFLGEVLCTASGPIVLTVLPPDKYQALTSIYGPQKVNFDKFTGPLPQILSDRFGWPQMVEGFAKRYDALPPDIRAKTGIFCDNYGEASAVNVLGRKYGLPTAISGHQNYFYWGWNNYSGESMLTLGEDAKQYEGTYSEVVDLGPFDAPWIMDRERLHYFWLRGRKHTFAEDWPKIKYWY
ncbi:MAG: glycosyltransferase family 39 protein [Terracidiphilus sp.]